MIAFVDNVIKIRGTRLIMDRRWKKKCETDLNTGSCTKDIIYLIYFIW